MTPLTVMLKNNYNTFSMGEPIFSHINYYMLIAYVSTKKKLYTRPIVSLALLSNDGNFNRMNVNTELL